MTLQLKKKVKLTFLSIKYSYSEYQTNWKRSASIFKNHCFLMFWGPWSFCLFFLVWLVYSVVVLLFIGCFSLFLGVVLMRFGLVLVLCIFLVDWLAGRLDWGFLVFFRKIGFWDWFLGLSFFGCFCFAFLIKPQNIHINIWFFSSTKKKASQLFLFSFLSREKVKDRNWVSIKTRTCIR